MKFAVRAIDVFEREVRLRLPFRFGVVTLERAPQAYVRARIRLENGKEAEGGAAEMLAPKWFDKDPALSDEENLGQLRASLALARDAYLAGGENTAFGHSIDHYGAQIALAATRGLNSLIACFGPALIDRALLDALCRALGVSFFDAVRTNLPGIAAPGWQGDLADFRMDEFLASLAPSQSIAVRHTVGLLDPISAQERRIGDGLPETLDEVLERYGHRWLKLKLSGEAAADLERLADIARLLERRGAAYRITLDGNEQYGDAVEALELWRRLKHEPALARLVANVAYIEQPVKRAQALSSDVSALAEERPVIIDESDDSLEAFPRARRLGYTGVSSKTCKGLYKSMLNAARCRLWNREEGAQRYFITGEDMAVQPGLALQQDLALASLLGIEHVERNGHHYVNGMAALPAHEQAAFLEAHPDLYERSHGAVRPKIENGMMSIRSLECPGYASAAMPDWESMS